MPSTLNQDEGRAFRARLLEDQKPEPRLYSRRSSLWIRFWLQAGLLTVLTASVADHVQQPFAAGLLLGVSIHMIGFAVMIAVRRHRRLRGE